MTQEHREQFLRAQGWQQTERGHVRGPEFGQVVLAYANKMDRDTCAVLVSDTGVRLLKCGGWRTSHRRRFPFGRQPKHDALVGWKIADDRDDEAMEKDGGLRELNEWATEAERIGQDESKKRDWLRLMVEFYMRLYPHTKRQGWKTIEVGDGEKREKVVVEVEG